MMFSPLSLRINLTYQQMNQSICKKQISFPHNKAVKSTSVVNESLQSLFLLLFIFLFQSFFSILMSAQIFEDLDPEYSISSVQADFFPSWDREWERTVTGFRLMGSSFDLHTIHTLQHWKGRFPFNDFFIFSFNYFEDADYESQFFEKELELKWKIRGGNYLSLFGYPYYDKKESDIGIRYSFEETPLDFIRFSLLFENAPNNYTFKNRDMDSMRIYKKIPIIFSFALSLIERQKNNLTLSYSLCPSYSANYEDRNGTILYSTKGEKCNIRIKHRFVYDNSSELGWRIEFVYNRKRLLYSESEIDSIITYTRLKPEFHLTKTLNSLYSMLFLFRYNLEQDTKSTNVDRTTFLLGILRNFSTHSKIGLSYCNGTTNYFDDKKRKDNRLILSAEHRFKNKSMVGMNLGIELDSRDTTHGWLGGYDKLFFFIQYPSF